MTRETTGPRLVSEDGNWEWDGRQWLPRRQPQKRSGRNWWIGIGAGCALVLLTSIVASTVRVDVGIIVPIIKALGALAAIAGPIWIVFLIGRGVYRFFRELVREAKRP